MGAVSRTFYGPQMLHSAVFESKISRLTSPKARLRADWLMVREGAMPDACVGGNPTASAQLHARHEQALCTVIIDLCSLLASRLRCWH